MSNSVRPHRRQPTRLPCPWDSPGKNTGVGCHFLLQCMEVKGESEIAQSCLTLSDPMDCSLPGSSIHGIFQASVLEWGAERMLNHLLGSFNGHFLPIQSCASVSRTSWFGEGSEGSLPMVITSYFFKCPSLVWGFLCLLLAALPPLGPVCFDPCTAYLLLLEEKEAWPGGSTWLAWRWRAETSPGHLGVQ